MAATLTLPETKFEKPAALLVPATHGSPVEPGSEPAAHRANPLAAVLRSGVLLAFAALGLALVTLAMIPGLFLTLVLFLPALAPFLLVGLSLVLTEDLEHSRAVESDDAAQPCTCHHDRMRRAWQHG